MKNQLLRLAKQLTLALALALSGAQVAAWSCAQTTKESTSDRYQRAYFVGKMRVISVSDEANGSITPSKGWDLPTRRAEVTLGNDIRPSKRDAAAPKQASVLLHAQAAIAGTEWLVIIDDEKSLRAGTWQSAHACVNSTFGSAALLDEALLPKAAIQVRDIHPDLLARMDKHYGLPIASLLQLKLEKLNSLQDHSVAQTIALPFDRSPSDRRGPAFIAQDLAPGVYRVSTAILDAKWGAFYLRQEGQAASSNPQRAGRIFTIEERGFVPLELTWHPPMHVLAVPGFAGGSAAGQLPNIFQRADKDADGSVQNPYRAWPRANYLIKYHGTDGKADYPAMRMVAGSTMPALAGYYSLSASWVDTPKSLVQTPMQFKEGANPSNGLFYLKPNDRADDRRAHAIYFPYYQDANHPNPDPAVPKWVTMGFDFTNLLGQAIAIEGISAYGAAYDELGKIVGQSSVFGVNKPPGNSFYVQGLEDFNYRFVAYARDPAGNQQKTIRTNVHLNFTEMRRTLRLE